MPKRLSEGIQGSGAALLLTALVVWLLSGCAIATRPADGVDLPQYARQTPSEMRDPPSRVSILENDVWVD
jgi:site-specific recombinase XerC